MFNDIFARHPLVSQMKFKGEQAKLYIEKLDNEENARLSGNGLRIGVDTLNQLFLALCSDSDIESLSFMLAFDYSQFYELSSTHRYYLLGHPFHDNTVLLDALEKANYFKSSEVSDFLLVYLKKRINAYSKITETDFESKSYNEILKTLEMLAVMPDYFDYAASMLLQCSTNEMSLGIYPAHYKAINSLKALFLNAGARVHIPLKERMALLQQFLSEAEHEHDFFRLFSLIKILGSAASAFEIGEHEYHSDPDYLKYIHFSIESLARFASKEDEHGLYVDAENMLHKILEETISSDVYGADDAPFIILKLFVEYNRNWENDPFYYLDVLDGHINELKNAQIAEQRHIEWLEQRLEKLVSVVGDRSFISEDFRLLLSAKNPDKACEIGVLNDPVTNLELHDKLSLTERLICSETTRIDKINDLRPRYTYIVGNFGLVVSTLPHERGGQHRRVFYSIPLEVPAYTIVGHQDNDGRHAEEALYDYLLEDENIFALINQFKTQFNINSANHKVYAAVFDLHGTYDMCFSCSAHGYNFQNEFRTKLIRALETESLKIVRKCPTQLPVIIRYSSNFRYHYSRSSLHKKIGELSLIKKDGKKRDLGSSSDERSTFGRDIKQFAANLLIHSNKWHLLWSYEKINQFKNRELPLQHRTAFLSDRKYHQLTEAQKQRNYTQDGLVETSFDIDSLSDLSRLSI